MPEGKARADDQEESPRGVDPGGEDRGEEDRGGEDPGGEPEKKTNAARGNLEGKPANCGDDRAALVRSLRENLKPMKILLSRLHIVNDVTPKIDNKLYMTTP